MVRVTSLVAAFLALFATASCGKPRQLNVVIVTLDTTRADRLGAYGYERGTSPNFDALAAESAIFDRAYAQSVVTSPSHLSMMTGLRPHSHGTLFNGERLRTDLPTLAERLSGRGYRTGGFVSAVVLAPKLSDVSRGFEEFNADFPAYRRGAYDTTDAAIGWLDSLNVGEPYFLFVHYYDAHGPFRASEDRIASFRRDVAPRPVEVPLYQRRADKRGGYHDDLEYYSDAYDASIQQQDDAFARLLRRLDRDRTIIVVLADHGESIGERYVKINHGMYVTEEQTRIPLIIHVPGIEPGRSDELVETTDLVPSLLDWLGANESDATRNRLDGRSIALGAEGGRVPVRERALSISAANSDAFPGGGTRNLDPRYPVVSLVAEAAPHWKLVRYPGLEAPTYELYRLDSDPLEADNLAAAEPELLSKLAAQLAADLPRLAEQGRSVLRPDVRAQLEALGYVE